MFGLPSKSSITFFGVLILNLIPSGRIFGIKTTAYEQEEASWELTVVRELENVLEAGYQC